MNTPWGTSQTTKSLAHGITAVSTAGHGGLYLAPERWQYLMAMFPGFQPWAGEGWLEEDCEWSFAVLAFPLEFKRRDIYNAVRQHRTPSEHYAGMFPEGFWESENGKKLLAVHDAEAATVQGLWEQGSMSAPVKGYGDGCWGVMFTRGEDRKTVILKSYPMQQYYTDAELETLRATKLEEAAIATH